MIKIEFEIVKDGMTFRDAIVLPVGHGYTDEQLEELKQKRFDAWYEIVSQEELDQAEIVAEESVKDEE
jgi:hypothetical protein